jgi:hypothetical protein
MADDRMLYVIGGLGLLYFLYSQTATAGVVPRPTTYPPPPGPVPKPPTSGGGTSTGGGGGGFSPGGGGGVTTPPRQTYVCSDGSLVTDPSLCPVGPSPTGGECADSTYVDDVTTQCPENVPSYTDTMDPCDPNSSMYDPTQCGTPTPPAQVCYDGGDVCDPGDCSYDPVACSYYYVY